MIRLGLSFASALICYAAAPEGMVRIPQGKFTMGRTKLTSDDKTTMRPQILLDDRPAREVFVSGLFMDSKEVSHEQYSRFAKLTKRATPYHWLDGQPPTDLLQVPVFNVSWEDAGAYCAWKGGRLPTEAEWEKAARGGKEGLDYPLSEKLDSKAARYASAAGPLPVGQFPPNGYGLYDMVGNVAEWCFDWFDREYYSRNENTDPQGPSTGTYKVIRGGAWSDAAKVLKLNYRNWVRPNQRTPNIGFRCAASATAEKP